MLPNIHIIGIQGSGKGTQSSLLVERYHLNYLAAGNLFRTRAAVGDDYGKEIALQMQGGHLLPDSYLYRTVKEYFSEHKIEHGLLGDGVIRTLEQYHHLDDLWETNNLEKPFFIHLILDESTALERIEKRKSEAQNQDKLEYHKTYSGKFVQRSDDNPLAIHERFRLFHNLTEALIQELDLTGRCKHVEAAQSVEAIHAEICTILEETYPLLRPHVTS